MYDLKHYFHHHQKAQGYSGGSVEECFVIFVDEYPRLQHPQWKESDDGWILRSLWLENMSSGEPELSYYNNYLTE